MPVQLEIISPERLLLRKDVDMAVLPGAEGDIAAMPDHAPLMLVLRGGLVSLYEGDKVTEQFFVAGGFADMTPDRCTILADEAKRLDEISVETARSRLAALETAFANVAAEDVDAMDTMAKRLQAARAEIEAAEEAHPTH
ncbi:ATP synthase F1 subunit epsilon [Brytella acorum]|uniref:ATP synthase epsilon chain n=1 Tax=Brytella acorum TaxID=2959299 RepID=A0AA35UJU7_9PROT|nr:ATP synthase F1 subunit epsilon [Brytella acorum]MDF3625727.1 ATP synthase F1 subunit epsilon [Brytella acorum]CAI9121682.1 ATP synthase F1 subunit epsilon [Brytella acorum]